MGAACPIRRAAQNRVPTVDPNLTRAGGGHGQWESQLADAQRQFGWNGDVTGRCACPRSVDAEIPVAATSGLLLPPAILQYGSAWALHQSGTLH